MKLLNKQNQVDINGVGSGCIVEVLDDDGIRRSAFFDHIDPTRAEVYAALPRFARLDPVTKADWERVMDESDRVWDRWKRAHAEAILRGAPANVLSALQSKEDAAWTAYLADIQAWRTAT